MKKVVLHFFHTSPDFERSMREMGENLEAAMNGVELPNDPEEMVNASKIEADRICETEEVEGRIEEHFIISGELMSADVTHTVMGSCGVFTDGSLKGTYFEL